MNRGLFIIYLILSGVFSYPVLVYGGSMSKDSLDYHSVIHKIFKDDDLFILFYMDAALIIDPMQDRQVAKTVDAEEPWGDIKEFLYGKSNIYFCPSDKQIGKAIEYMKCPIDTAMSMYDKFGMYRLSSPKELFKNRGDSFRQSNHKAVVFGGLQYDDTVEYEGNLLAFRGQDYTREQGIQYTPLKSSYLEAIYVDSVMRKNGMEVALLTGENGNESSFYDIPNYNVDILHIASHAYYTPESDNTSSETLQEWMLSHAGMVLSGGNNGCNFTKNDGHLTAYEISQTDLSSIKLAVLSACETGQGDVHQNNVYGLLQGMKIAGAGTIMVSLSKVYDTATSILMNRFYENIFRGDNPRRALENAQRFLRLYNRNQYDSPEFWSRFILIDDLDRNIGNLLTAQEKDWFLYDIISMDKMYDNHRSPQYEIVQEKLNPNAVFIRFFNYSYNNERQYVAMVADPMKTHNSIVRLFSSTLLDDYFQYLQEKSRQDENRDTKTILDFISIEKMDSILWYPLKPYLEGKTTIYVQAMGIFENYPIELMPSVTNRDFYRISSLDVLLDAFNRHESLPSNKKQIVLYGGLNYDEDPYESEDNGGTLIRGSIFKLNNLPGAGLEVDEIAKLCTMSNWSVFPMTGSLGTEKSFREIEQYSVGTIHIATHGFSLSGRSKFLKNKMDNIDSIEDLFLSNCGLAFSGANNYIHNSENNDGIILGRDIRKMKLKNVDFVVLSTCNMLNGKQDYDLTWNMIYAFKLAGVKSIMYSMWSVDDESTVSLMVEFYRNWISGMTKNTALEKAKRYVRSHEKWNNPKYWAAFVLIDSIE